MKGKGWRSRKLICALVGAALPVFNEILALGIPVQAMVTSICSLIGFIAGESVIDAQRVKRRA